MEPHHALYKIHYGKNGRPNVCSASRSDPEAIRKNCIGGQMPAAARQIADILDRIPYDNYVEPFLGNGSVWKARKKRGKVEVLNDKDCMRVRISKALVCWKKDNEKCKAFSEAKVSCKRDYKEFLKRYDHKKVLFYLDPPYHDKIRSQSYKHQGIDFEEFVRKAKAVKKASVAISYSNNPDFRKAFCGRKSGFRCHTIRKSFMKYRYKEVLAVKVRK